MEQYTSHKISFFGHRIQDIGGFQGSPTQTKIQEAIERIILECKEKYDKCTVLTGLNLGIETWAAQIASKHGVDFDVFIPFDNPQSKWPAYAKKAYTELLKKSRHKIQTGQGGFDVKKLIKKEEEILLQSNTVYTFFVNPPPLLKVAERNNVEVIDSMPQEEPTDDGWWIGA